MDILEVFLTLLGIAFGVFLIVMAFMNFFHSRFPPQSNDDTGGDSL
jgi:heme/copper-type cytochrome/quinol oxidase subunit 2